MDKRLLSLPVIIMFLLLGNSAWAQPCLAIKSIALADSVSCNKGSDGSINLVNVTGGISPYTYNWSGPGGFVSNNEDLTGVSAGTYYLTVEDANNCQGVDTFIVSQPGAFVYNANLTNASCNGSADGSIGFSLSGGTPPYDYIWSNIQGDTLSQSQNINGLVAGIYGLSVKDNKGCTGAIFYIIAEPDSLIITAEISDISCAGEKDGAIDITTMGGTGVKSYVWSSGELSEDLDGEESGTYTVTATDMNGCEAVNSFVIQEPDSLEIDLNITNVSCNGANDGSVEAIVSGGTPPFNYIWSDGGTAVVITGLEAGTYDVTIIDDNGCTIAGSAAVVDTNAAVTATAAVTNISCFGLSDGSIDITVMSGNSPFSFEWSTGDSTEDIGGLTAGTYNVTITDSLGCTLELNDIEVEEPEPIQVNVTDITDITCNGEADGSIEISVTGGAPPYTFNWSNGALSANINNLPAGEYCVVVTDSDFCISDTFCFQVNEPEDIQLTPDITQPVCNGVDDGSIEVTASGGTPPYQYTWDTGDTTQLIGGLTPGNYSITAEDANGCSTTDNYTINEPDTINVEFNSVINVSCNGESDGSIDISVTGGTPPYTFNWSNGDSTEDISGLDGGFYQVTVTDQNGCMDMSDTVIVEEPDTFSLQADITDVVCPSDSNGAIDLTVIGGTPPYIYQWALGDTTEDLNMIPGGTYTVTVTDSNGCQATGSFVVIDPPIDDVRIDVIREVQCHGDTFGILCAIVDGVPPPFTYLWSNGETTECISGVTAGLYSVTVRDDIGCFSFYNNFFLNEPDEIQLTADVTQVTCEGGDDGSIDLSVAGGKAPYSYYWSNSATTQDIDSLEEGTYTVNVSDSNGCEAQGSYTINPINPMVVNLGISNASCGEADGTINITVSGGTPPFIYEWSNGNNTEFADSLTAGIYEITVTDASGCIKTAIALLDNVSDMEISANNTNPVCGSQNSGAIAISISGGTAPFTYNWSNGANTKDLTGLVPGQFLLTVTDADSCQKHLVIDLTEESDLSLTFNTSPSGCGIYNTGAAEVTVTGASAPYNYLWSDGQTTNIAGALAAGIHYVTVTDINGCMESASVVIIDSGNVSLNLIVQDVTCIDGNSGSIVTNVSGGAAPYTFSWSDGTTANDLTGISAGLYSVTVTDTLGCSAVQSEHLESPDSLIAIANKFEPLCYQAADGTILVTVNGGTQPFNYNWSTGDSTQDITGIISGNYIITVTDAKGCAANINIDLNEPDSIVVVADSIIPAACNGGADGSLDVTIAGGTMPYIYNWSNGETTEDLANLEAGEYCLVVTDANGCVSDTFCFRITEPDEIVITQDVRDATCHGGEDGAITVTVAGGTPPFTYSWDTGGTSDTLSGLEAGTYVLTVTDFILCEATASITVSEPAPFDFSSTIISNVSCDTAFDGSIVVDVTGGTAPYQFIWGDTTLGATLDSVGVGNYQVTVIDANLCEDTSSFNITGPTCNNPPVAVNDTAKIFTCSDEPVNIPVLDNDYDPDGDALSIAGIFDGPTNGGVSINLDQTLTYIPFEDFVGIDTFYYIIADDGLPQLFDTAMVVVTVLPCRPNIFIPNGFSPNGDDVNDFFEIVDIHFFPDNELIIFNRWGNKIIDFNGYKNEWAGKNKNGEDLPDGTYYYVLKLNDELGTSFTGYIIIHR